MNKASKSYLKFLKKITKTINSLLKKSVREYENEDYHQLRVEIKKLNAVLDCLKFCSKNCKRKKYLKPFKKIFKQAGTIREIQLEETMLKKFPQYSIEHYLNDLERRIKKEQKKLSSIINKRLRRKIKRSFGKIKPLIHKIKDQKVKEFMENERKKIKDLIQQKSLAAEDIHEIRKRLKVDYYNRKILPLSDNQNVIEEEDRFLELLGKWHDCRIMNDQLEKSIIEEEIDPTELNALLEINADVSLEADVLFKEINSWIEKKKTVV